MCSQAQVRRLRERLVSLAIAVAPVCATTLGSGTGLAWPRAVHAAERAPTATSKPSPVPQCSWKDPVALPPEGAADYLIRCAAEAQDQVKELREDLDGLYAMVDRAAKKALTRRTEGPQASCPLAPQTAPNGAEPLRAEVLVACAVRVYEEANKVRGSLGDAQRAANEFVGAALQLKNSCAPDRDGRCTIMMDITRAKRHYEELVEHLSDGKKRHEQLRELALQLESRDASARDLRFARLMRDFPEAKSALGENAYFLSAGTKDSEASLRLVKDFERAGGVTRLTATVTTPLGDEDQVKLYDRADGLAGKTQLAIGLGSLRLARLDRLFLFNGGVSAAREKRFYLLEVGPPAEETVTVHPMGFNLSAAWFNPEGRNQNTHVAKLSWQRTYKNKSDDEVTRCEVPAAGAAFAKCLQGVVGPPQRETSWVLSYQWRAKLSKGAMAPQIAYNTRSRVVDVEIPLYLVRSLEEDKEKGERPFNAGISLGWVSKGKTEITERTGGQTRFSVFIGAPFSLLEFGN